MNNIFRGEQGLGTQETAEYQQLHDTHLATELGLNTDRIVNVLGEDENQAPYNVMTWVKGQGFLLQATKDSKEEGSLRIHFIDNSCVEGGSILIKRNTGEESLNRHFNIATGTFDQLETLVIDPDIAKANVETRLANAL